MPDWRRCLRLFEPDVRVDVDDELRFHLEARIADYEARGYAHAEAERLARQRFGDAEVVRRALETHDMERQRRRIRREFMSQLVRDICIAFRGLRRTPGFALAVLATLALGIGANTAVFSVVSRELIDPLPYGAADRLVLLYSTSARVSRGFVSPNEIATLQQSSRTLASVAAFGSYGGYTYVGEQETVSWRGVSVGPGFFRALDVTPLIGRLIDERDVEPGASNAVVLGYEIWQQNFGGDTGVVGRTITMSDATWRVIGVTRPSFAPPARSPQVFTPLDVHRFLGTRAADALMLQAVARLADGATRAQAESEIRVLAHPGNAVDSASAPFTLSAVPIRDAMVGDVRPVLLALMGAALLVLALACLNVAGLFLARAAGRRHEMAVRAALGAGRLRIARQLVTETAALGLTGGGLGVLVAVWGKNAFLRLGDRVLPPTGTPPAVDGRVLTFALLISLTVGIVVGLLPALFGTRGDLSATLGASGRGSAGGRVRTRVARALVAGQIALAALLLVAAGLLGSTLVALEHEEMGYDASQHVLSVTVSLPRSYGSPAAQVAFFGALLTRLRSVPGVESAGLVGIAPWNGWNHTVVRVDRGPSGAADSIADSVNVPLGQVSDGYFTAAGTRLVGGRAFAGSDRNGSLPVAIVSERFARLAWPGRGAVGERVQIADVDIEWRTVVGVVSDVRESAADELEATIYVPAWQSPQRWYEMLVRSAGDAGTLLPAVRHEIRAMDPALPALGPRTLDQMLSASLQGRRLPVMLTGVFALLALVLAALGIYSVIAYTVTLRTRELGIRTALGGSRGDLIRLVLRDGLAIAVAGTAVGIGVAAAVARVIGGLLYGVTAHDPATFVASAVVLLLASTAACLLPARRATRIPAVEALRAE